MKIKTIIQNLHFPEQDIQSLRGQASSALDSLWGSKDPEDAWVQLPMKYTEEDIDYLLNAADYVKGWAKLMVVIGNPVSCAGPKAAIETLEKYEYGIEVLFAGSGFNTEEYAALIEKVKANEAVLCLLSDYEDTPETTAAFAILKDVLEQKLGSQQAVSRRIIAVTDKGTRLWEEAEREEYLIVTSPTGLNGSFNMLAVDGLFPMSVAGLDVRSMLEGAREVALSPMWDAGGADYAIARHLMKCKGHVVEWIVPTDLRLEAAVWWLKRLYDECETNEKDGGLLCGLRSWPIDMYTVKSKTEKDDKQKTETASFETILRAEGSTSKIIVPSGTLEGKNLTQLQTDALEAFVQERKKANRPIVQVHLEELDASAFGQFIYFFEMSATLSKMLRKSC